MLKYETGRSTDENQLDARKPWVVFISQRSEKLRLYNMVQNLDDLKPWLKSVIFSVSPG
jgi:hypothetical protein